MLHGGRWNSVGQRVIYAAESYAGAMLEVLVHANLSIPPKHHRVVRITIPDSLRVQTILPSQLQYWDAEDLTEARAAGDRWLNAMRTAVLRVPSVVTEGRESNILINPLHPDFPRITASVPEPVHWDHRLFGRSSER